MKRMIVLLALGAVVFSLGCYHATIVTGAKAGDTVIDKPWANSFIFGLVPPATVEAAAQCPGGVAMVETEHSFLNWLVGGITLGIYTPIHIKVTCAGSAVSVGGGVEYLVPEADLVIREDATPEQAREIFQEAVELAVESDAPVVVKFAAMQQ